LEKLAPLSNLEAIGLQKHKQQYEGMLQNEEIIMFPN
jgi:hypothetical protein